MSRFPRWLTAAAALSIGAALIATTPAAQAHRPNPGLPTGVLASDLLTPLSAAVDDDGTAYVSSNFGGQILKVRAGKAPKLIYTDPNGYEVGGLSVDDGVVTFVVTRSDRETFENTGSWLKRLYSSGKVRTVADLNAHETKHNPDRRTSYGFRKSDPECDAKWPAEIGAPAAYQGGIDSHPYATATKHGSTYVADAGGNTVLSVSSSGRVKTVATLPGIPYTFTPEVVEGFGLDPCFVDRTYYFEGVPTDVETGPGGRLYVSSLPGGPEGPELGARGSVFSIDAKKGHLKQVARGFLGATGVAVSHSGTIYVAEMFANK
ncbi:MAG: ScyD/ScyE family protein, partial [Nocardioides sp.]|uniref:ScyD/ScyE family protein n=1 Tax=Nocardioides sp. TaxID=35761 RepID=UPI003D6C3406